MDTMPHAPQHRPAQTAPQTAALARTQLDRASERAGAPSINVGRAERVASTLLGSAFVLSGLRRGSMWGALLAVGGGLLIQRGMTGHCAVYARFGIGDARDESARFDPARYGNIDIVPEGVLASAASGA